MSEPFYVRQTAEPMTEGEQRAWFQKRADEAKAEGATWFRCTVHARDARILLVEGWKQRPAKEGEPRFALVKD